MRLSIPTLLSLSVLPAGLAGQTLAPGPGSAATPLSGFGASVLVADGEILVSRTGAEVRMATYPQAGALYVFGQTDSGWSVVATVAPADGVIGDRFGSASAAVEGLLLVGASGAADARGRGYVFERDGATWVERARLDPGADPRAGAGSAVAIGAGTAFLGAPGGLGGIPAFGQTAPPQPGAVHVFTEAGGSWVAASPLSSPEPEGTDRFGAALAASGDRLFVGAPGADGGRGAVFHFRRSGGDWTLSRTLRLERAAAGAAFGSALAVDGERLLVGAPGVDRAGTVLVFEGGATTPVRTIVAPDGAAGFGATLAPSDGVVWVGAPGSDGGAGRAFAVDGATGEVSQTLTGAHFGPGSAFGSSLAASGTLAVVAAGFADLRLGAASVFERTGAAWEPVGTLRDPSRSSVAAITGETVSCEEGSAADFSCADVDLVAFVPLPELGAGPASIANDIWGWTDSATGREYVLLGKSNGTSFVDISDPGNPVYVGELPLHDGATENLWRDIKTYADHAFIVADGAGEHGVQIFDLTQLRDVRETPVTFEETAHYDGIHSSHNIVINEETGFAHAVGSSGGGQACGGGLHMIDVRDPQNPRFAGCFSDPSTGGFLGGGYTHDAQCVVYHGPDEDFAGREICFHASIDALGISDITDKDAPTPLARADYPGVVGAHQGWLSEDHRYFFMGDELDEESGTVDHTRTLVWDIAELDDPVLATEYFAETRAIDHNMYVRGDYLYQSNLMSGLRILDVSDPENPVEVGFFDTVPYDDDATAFGGSWSNYPYFESGVIAVSSWGEGLFLLRKRETRLVP